ncbi:MAG: ATP-binding protein [Clostridiales Family XIII bacterium]|jgi:serine/threonine-protein kinase RsbW|nr:ATP-binding protein [Clostridiales Family XIII bacterium]
MADLLKLNVPGKPEYVGTVRMAASSLASGAGFDVEAIDDIKVAVSEACTNIVRHAHEGPDFVYDVSFEIEREKLTITVKDDGAGYNIEEYSEPVPGEIRESGLGLFIIKALMDEVDVQSEIGVGTHIRMTKYLQTGTA